jgi:hypothetical protein
MVCGRASCAEEARVGVQVHTFMCVTTSESMRVTVF